ncbi:MAG: (d)CMP kinase [Candidatus Paralactobacillus gallistercoris]|uniref:Cytidylate kinase n=1 Tax=Candidatus Paralactobacillus gallistercoris TaxID=2838724 RepID=A0A948X0N2_9LACO|nr:(d)CMP kinase [Candidatus Paralactobacillus gallistercoris]
MQIAIDGPASAGKSTVAKLIATRLGYIYCDTGAMYRVVTLLAIQNHIAFDDEKAIMQKLQQTEINFQPTSNGQKVFMNDQDVTNAIRQPDVTNNVSQVAALAAVRKELVTRQQKIAAEGNIVMDGRDIGTTVLPNAEVKIFMIASAAERAQRRYKENIQKGINTPLDVLEKEIVARDYKDSHRKISPLQKATDAIELDTTHLTIPEVVDKIITIINSK